jgi:hypothetical protein
VLGGVADGADLHFRGAAGNAHDQLQVRGEKAAVTGVDLADETADHHLGGVEVRDHAVAERTDGADAGIRLLVHQLGLLAEGDALVGCIVDGDNRGSSSTIWSFWKMTVLAVPRSIASSWLRNRNAIMIVLFKFRY